MEMEMFYEFKAYANRNLSQNTMKLLNSSLIVWETKLAGIISGCTRPAFQGRKVQQWA